MKRKDYVCEEEGCNRRFTTVYNLWSHMKLHTRPNHIVCQVPNCDEKFQTKRALEVHMKSHDQRHAPYVCQHEGCGKRYYSSNALTSHQRSHSYKDADVKCSWTGCGKVFDKPCRLKAHLRSHTGCKPYHCTYQDCKWSFSSSSKLKRHQKKHTNERKFVCDVPDCGKAFMRSEHLKEHRLTHTDGRYFQCYVCDARFSAKSSLYVHIKKHQTRTTEELAGVTDDASEYDVSSAVGTSGQKRARTEESYCSRVKAIDTKILNRRTADTVNVERFTKHLGLRDSDDIEEQLGAKSDHDPGCARIAGPLQTVYRCPMEACAHLCDSMANLRQHMLKVHNIAMMQCDKDVEESLDGQDPISNTTMDCILYTMPSSYSNSSAVAAAGEQVIMVMADDARAVNPNDSSPSATTDHCLPEPEPEPPPPPSPSPPPSLLLSSFNNVVPSKIARSSRVNELRNARTALTTGKNQGSARTNFTFMDVLKLKLEKTLTDADRVPTVVTPSSDAPSSAAVALETSEACESLLTEELPSMYYREAAEYQVLLLDSGPLESV